jgi:PAS domain S-box-containing protein
VRFIRSISEEIPNDEGVPVRITGTDQDITEQVQATELLRESEERFRKVFEEGPLGMATISSDGRILDVNEAASALLGYNAEELKTLTAPDFTHPEDIAMDLKLTRQLFAGEIPHFRIEKRLIKKNGEVVWVNLAATVIRSADGEPIYGLGMVEDITERKRAEAELRESEERLRASEARLMSAQRLVRLGSWERDDITGNTSFSDEMLRILGFPDKHIKVARGCFRSTPTSCN